MNDEEYEIIPLHRKPELTKQCCKLLNSEWPRSETARLISLKVSCDSFPTSLILVNKENQVVGHCKISVVPKLNYSCYIESVVIGQTCRSQGLGSKLLRGAEQYAQLKGIRNMYLMTKGQEKFYLKNGYRVCDPFKMYSWTDFVNPSYPINRGKVRERTMQFSAPPPPPMPNFPLDKPFDIRMLSRKTHMVKKLTN